MRSRILRRSSSSADSPAPLPPIPPRWRSFPLPRLAQPRNHVLQPHDLDLGLGGARTRVPAEDLQDDRGPVQHLDAGLLLEVPGLRRRDVVIDQHRLDLLASPRRRRPQRLHPRPPARPRLPRRAVRTPISVFSSPSFPLPTTAAGSSDSRFCGDRRDDLDAQRLPQTVQLGQRRGESRLVDLRKLDGQDRRPHQAASSQRAHHRGDRLILHGPNRPGHLVRQKVDRPDQTRTHPVGRDLDRGVVVSRSPPGRAPDQPARRRRRPSRSAPGPPGRSRR